MTLRTTIGNGATQPSVVRPLGRVNRTRFFDHRRCRLGFAVLVAVVVVGCTPTSISTANENDETLTVNTENAPLLDEINQAGTWFHAKKTKSIWAKEVAESQTVQTLEGEERVEPGDYLCRGEIGEIWPQSGDNIAKKYVSTDEVVDGWRKYAPSPDAKGVMAAQVAHAFEVQASWGKLQGKPGDFLVKNFDDADAKYPKDIWIVDKNLFEATYLRVQP